MKKFLLPFLFLLMLVIPMTVFAHTQTISTTVFYACEATSASGSIHIGDIDVNSITQDDTLSCANNNSYPLLVQWNAAGIPGTDGKPGVDGTNGTNGQDGKDGTNGTNGVDGTNGKDGTSGLLFNHPACTETGLTGSAQQENLLFCVSGVEKDGGAVYLSAISAAKVRIMIGTPLADIVSVDWSGNTINYVSFTSGFHAEYHPTDNVVRIYNTLNHQVA